MERKPFFARYLESQDLASVAGGSVSDKYPSDNDEHTMPHNTRKYPSDWDEIL